MEWEEPGWVSPPAWTERGRKWCSQANWGWSYRKQRDGCGVLTPIPSLLISANVALLQRRLHAPGMAGPTSPFLVLFSSDLPSQLTCNATYALKEC